MSRSTSLPRALPESQGVSSKAILSFLDGIEADVKDLHSFMMLRHGAVVAEGWWRPYGADRPHMLFSLSKSFTSTAVGFAVAEGRLRVDDPVLSFFPGEAPRKPGPNLQAMKVRHLLSMSTGHDKDTMEAMFGSPGRSIEKRFLALPVEHEPGTHFLYNTGASYMLSAIVQRVAGQRLTDYLTPRLFKPLGIEGARWDSFINGVDFGGFGLNLRTEDIARFGQLYLAKGLWNGKRILPESWIAEATSKQISNGDMTESDWSHGYGYQFWRCRPRGVYRGDGAFGQYCIVMPEQDAVIAITSGLGDMQPVLTRIWERILPGIHDQPMAADKDAETLTEKTRTLHIDPPQGSSASTIAGAVTGRTFTLQKNDLKLSSVRFSFSPDSCTLRMKQGRTANVFSLGYGRWEESRVTLPAEHGGWPEASIVAGSGVWEAPDTFVATIRRLSTPFVYTMSFRFSGSDVSLDWTVNVSFGPTTVPTIRGKAGGA
jgi:CubicO group peptidase (beta-lactamase class C family)